MQSRKDNSDNYLSSALFMALFFIFICAFAKNNDPPVTRYSHYKSVSENLVSVIALNDAQQYSTPKNIIRCIENTDLKLQSGFYKTIHDDKSIHHTLLFLQKSELLLKPVILLRL